MNHKSINITKRLFIKRKYGKELLIDCSKYSSLPLPQHPYTTDFYGIFIITGGSGRILIDNEIVNFKKGTLIFFQPGQISQWEKYTSNFDGYFLVFVKEFVETFFHDPFFIYRFQFFNIALRNHSLNCDISFFKSIIEFCKTINTELLNLQDDSHHYLRSILYNILIQINRKFIDQYQLSSSLFQDNIALKLLKLLDDNIKKYHKVEEYAEKLQLSRSYLNKLSQKFFGQPISSLIKEHLANEIKRDLLFSNKSIKEICFDMNLSDVPNFVRFFKNVTGLTPTEYRQQSTK